MPKWTKPSEAMPDPAVCKRILCILRYPSGLELQLYECDDDDGDYEDITGVGGMPDEYLRSNQRIELWAYESDVCQIADILRESTK